MTTNDPDKIAEEAAEAAVDATYNTGYAEDAVTQARARLDLAIQELERMQHAQDEAEEKRLEVR